jgi:hypothetical protein
VDISKSKGPSLLSAYPSPPPPSGDLPEWYGAGLERMSEQSRSLVLWTNALARRFMQSLLWQRIPGFRFAAYGFADPEFEADAFAVLAYAAPIRGIQDEVTTISFAAGNDEVTFPGVRSTYFRGAAKSASRSS